MSLVHPIIVGASKWAKSCEQLGVCPWWRLGACWLALACLNYSFRKGDCNIYWFSWCPFWNYICKLRLAYRRWNSTIIHANGIIEVISLSSLWMINNICLNLPSCDSRICERESVERMLWVWREIQLQFVGVVWPHRRRRWPRDVRNSNRQHLRVVS